MTARVTEARTLTANGLANADVVVAAAQQSGVPLWILAAMVEKESNGLNVYGDDRNGVFSRSDPQRPSPATVTAANYAAFERRVLSGSTSNGVGPAQITYPGFIRDAKTRGIRLWVPSENVLYGAALLAGYLKGRTDDQSIRQAGTLYNAGNLLNGVNAYGNDLLTRARLWRTRLEGQRMTLQQYPPRSGLKTDAFWRQLEAVERQNGVDITCGPSSVRSGACRPGRHGHWAQSRHWPARALDMSMDPRPGVPISQYEKTHLTAKCLMLRARYGAGIGIILNRATDHKDHAHADDGQSGYQVNGVYDYRAIGDELIYARNGKRVADWQRMLVAAGYRISVDGSFGLQTYDTTRAAQYAWGLRPDAIVGPKTIAAAKARAKNTTPAPSKPKPSPNMKAKHPTNVRAGAGTNHRVVAGLRKGDRWRPSLRNGKRVTSGRWLMGRTDAMRDAKAAAGWVHMDNLEPWS